jgi:hypothetical protein
MTKLSLISYDLDFTLTVRAREPKLDIHPPPSRATYRPIPRNP